MFEERIYVSNIQRPSEKIMCEVLIVIPALNEAMSIGSVIDAINNALAGIDHRILVVDGNSTDGTDHIAASKGAIVIYQEGKGYGNALMTGFVYGKTNTTAEILVMLDADLTYDPNDLLRLLDPVFKGEADMVIGNRFAGMQKGAMTTINKFGNRIISWLVRILLGVDVHDTQCGMRVFSTHLVDVLRCKNDGMAFATEMLVYTKNAGARIMEVSIRYMPRVGKSKLNPLKDGAKILGTIVKLIFDSYR
ncbi:MAG: glycosyltransferase family 2 protein [Candidatus Nitrosocaldus sp.]|nr:glycosyltransferase family 2 protein [Candidatus Nitrosocaldus sp.]MDW8275067.1 glycosyltransferase family 2 protein [Candidatus Nitrosocaldus sp.]